MSLEFLIRRGLRMGQWIIFLLIVNMIFLGFKFNYSTKIEKDVLRTQAKLEVIEKLQLDFMRRTVDRWDRLKQDNPHVSVPLVNEPQPPK